MKGRGPVAKIPGPPSERLKRLERGLDIVEFSAFVPWKITKHELYDIIPERNFNLSVGGHWPQLRFNFLGFETLFSFNFVTNSESRLCAISFSNEHRRRRKRTFRRSSRALINALGKPNLVDIGRAHVSWSYGDLIVENGFREYYDYPSMKKEPPVHVLEVSHWPRKRDA